MAKRFFYVAGDDSKTPVDHTKQPKGTDLVRVSSTGEETPFKAGSKFTVVGVKGITLKDTPDAVAELEDKAQFEAKRAVLKAKKTVHAAVVKKFVDLSAEEKANKIADAKAKAAALKASHAS